MNGSYISATTSDLHGIPASEPILRLTLDVEAGGLSDGASALFLITGSIHADSGRNLSLGTAAPVLKQLGFSAREGGTAPYTTLWGSRTRPPVLTLAFTRPARIR